MTPDEMIEQAEKLADALCEQAGIKTAPILENEVFFSFPPGTVTFSNNPDPAGKPDESWVDVDDQPPE